MIAGRYGEDTIRLRFIIAAMIGAFLFLLLMIWRLQILDAHQYMGRQQSQSVRRVRLPGMRGRIYDRNEVCLAKNRPSFCIAMYLEELRRPGGWGPTVDAVDEHIENISKILGLARTRSRADIVRHVRRRSPLPFMAWSDISKEAVARLEEACDPVVGVDIYIEPIRTYPHGKLAAHVLGYIGRADPSSVSSDAPDYYLPEMDGKKGIELEYNDLLAGFPGAELIRVDASGFRRDILQEKSLYSYPGEDIYTTIDSRIQRVAEEVINERRGAAVVINPRNGDVIALASSPSFDPNIFSPAISSSDWSRLRGDEDKPFLNRAISGAYPPGSIFKPIVALSALENNDVTSEYSYTCTGVFSLGRSHFRCWKKAGHGRINMRKAIEQSCNAYFCQLGLKTGHQGIIHMAKSIGLGSKTGIDIGHESVGLVPDDEWKRRVLNDDWRPGDTCNISIGQGALLVTPLQMAVYTAALANGGHVFLPRIVKQGQIDGEELNRLAWSDRTLSVIRGGMYDVVNSDHGTGRRARLEDVHVAGKTGSAQYGKKGQGKTHAWMIAFAPFESPRYAAVIIVEDGVSGGTTAAPRMGRLLEGIFKTEPMRKDSGGI